MQKPRPLRAFLDRKNEPCPQSCWIMNSRIKKPAVGNVSRSVSQ